MFTGEVVHRDVQRRSCPSGLAGRLARWLAATGVAVLAFSSIGGSVAAQDDEGPAIFGSLKYESADGEDVPVPDVEIVVADVGSVLSDENGEWRIVVPADGEYSVTINVETLPSGVVLRNPDRATNPAVNVTDGREQRALFPLVEAGGAVVTNESGSITGRRIAQLAVEGLKQGLYLAMAAIGLSLIFGTTGLVNFAHAELVTWGQLSTFMFNYYGLAGFIGFLAPLPGPFGDGVNLVFAAVLGMASGALLGYALDRGLFRSMRRSGVSLIAQMVVTIGLSILVRYLFLYNFGGNPRFFRDYSAQTAISIGPVDITPKDLIAVAISIVVLLLVGALLQLTRIGKAMRAVADNRDLAESSGIDVQRVISVVWIAGGALAALGGVFFGLDQIKWDFGFRVLLLIFAAVTLGGLGTAYGALVGALVVGLVINLSTLFIDAELKNMVALLVLVLILLFRPQGILGRAERVG